MPKMKTRKAAAKRFRVLKGGKVRRNRAAKSHLLESKGTQQKRRNRKSVLVNKADMHKVQRLLPNG